MTSSPTLFGAAYSVYVRVAQLALAEKGVDFEHTSIDVFAPGGPPGDHDTRHPFGRIPAFVHAGFSIYETGAITRYIDEAFAGPALQPTDVRERARCNQIISIADNYAYPSLVWGVYVERVSKPRRGEATDDAKVQSALATAATCLRAMTGLIGGHPWLAGTQVTLADLYVAPMVAYFVQADEGRDMLQAHGALAAWWSRMETRPSMRATETA